MVRVRGWHKILKMMRTPFPLKERHSKSLGILSELIEYHRYVPMPIKSKVIEQQNKNNEVDEEESEEGEEGLKKKSKLISTGASTYSSPVSSGYSFNVNPHPYPAPNEYSRPPSPPRAPDAQSAPPGYSFIPDQFRAAFQQYLAKEKQKESNRMPVRILALDRFQMNTRGLEGKRIGSTRPEGPFSQYTIADEHDDLGWLMTGHMKPTPSSAWADKGTPISNRNLHDSWDEDLLGVPNEDYRLRRTQRTGNSTAKKTNPAKKSNLF